MSSSAAPDETESTSRRLLNSATIYVTWLIMLASVHVMYVAFLLFGSKPRSAAVLATLTQNGRDWYLPERELPIYVVGCSFALAASLGFGYWWRLLSLRRQQQDAVLVERTWLFSPVLAAVASIVNIGWLMAALNFKELLHLSNPAAAFLMLLPVPFELAALYLSQVQGGAVARSLRQLKVELSRFIERFKCVYDTAAEPPPRGPKTRSAHRLIDSLVVLVIFLLIYIPRTDLLAGWDFQFQSFHHWDFFAMGPAIGLLKGKALAAQVYSQYGLGWPLLLAKLDPLIRLSYGHTYKIAVTYGCIYYCGVYWLMRRLLPGPAWAIAGLMLVFRLQVFHSGDAEAPLWCIPSATILRTPFDIWVLLLLHVHWRTQRSTWHLIAGALVGLELLFVIDTGVYLLLTFIVYNLAWMISGRRMEADTGEASASKAGLLVASLGLGALVLVSGMYAASGSSVLAPGYLRSCLEVLWAYPSGIMMLPMVNYPIGVVCSYWFVVVLLGNICAGVVRCYSKISKDCDPLVLCISLLGLFYLIYYIGRSHPYTLYQLSTPFCVVSMWSVQRIVSTFKYEHVPERSLASTTAVAVIGLLVLLDSPQFRTYPNMITSAFKPSPRHIECYMPELNDVCVTPDQNPCLSPFRQAVSELKSITRAGKTFAIVADDDTSLYVASRSPLWNRYTPLLPPLATQTMLNEVDRQLSSRPVDFVYLIRRDPFTYSGHPLKWRLARTTESWKQLAATVQRSYHFDHDCGAYEVWRR